LAALLLKVIQIKGIILIDLATFSFSGSLVHTVITSEQQKKVSDRRANPEWRCDRSG
jgi:hypothetical protein